MIEIFHVSDLHFEKSEKQTKRSKLLLKKIKEKFKIGEAENKYLLITGDTVQDGEKKEYKIALQALIPFKENRKQGAFNRAKLMFKDKEYS